MMSFNIPAHETPEQARQRMQAQQMQLASSMPTDVNSGVQAVANAMMARQAQHQAQFPAAPGGAKPSLLQGFKNMFGLGGGLY
jgi:hypothetical protein